MQEELKSFPNNYESVIRTFGRIKSRKLSDRKNFLLHDLLPIYKITHFSPELSQKTCLEIGFGFGDFLFAKAKQNPNTFFIGSEPHLNGIVNLLSKLEAEPLQNLRIFSSDIRLFFQNSAVKFDEILILFPDPWPKSKHFKRRLITTEFLDNVLSPHAKNGAKLTIASDHDSYKTWILAQILQSKKFTWLANSKADWQNFPDDWVVTKYQKKASLEGRKSIIFNLTHHD